MAKKAYRLGSNKHMMVEVALCLPRGNHRAIALFDYGTERVLLSQPSRKNTIHTRNQKFAVLCDLITLDVNVPLVFFVLYC